MAEQATLLVTAAQLALGWTERVGIVEVHHAFIVLRQNDDRFEVVAPRATPAWRATERHLAKVGLR